jgi:ankyrin repeat protein
MLSAIINGHYDVAAFLLEKGADPNLADVTGRTPLYAAVDFNTMPQSNRPAPKVIHNQVSSLDLIASLLGRGANPNARLKRQQPYRTKLDRGNDTMFGAGTTPIIRAAKAGDVAAMKLLLKHGADAKLTTGAEGEGDASVGTGANANRRGGGVNALMAAAGVGTREEDATGRLKTEADAIETIKLCLEAGLDVNAADANGRTALHGAALFGYDKVIRFLAEHGARIDVKDKRGFTPLDMAAGKAGGVGFDGRASNPHPSTEALLKELIGAKVGG